MYACGSGDAVKLAKQAADQLHDEMAARNFEAIDSQTTEGFRSKIGLEQMKRLRERTGVCSNHRLLSSIADTSTRRALVTLRYSEDCESGLSNETLVWIIISGTAKLDLYSLTHANPGR
jgi:hypothetical protein